MISLRVLGLAGTVAVAGCRLSSSPQVPPSPQRPRTPYPDFPVPDDPLATEPCAVRKEPDIVVRNAPVDLLRPLGENLEFLRKANPIFLCGLERIDLLGDPEYRASADPKFTRRSSALYTPMDRVVRLKASDGIVLTHEIGHHIHNLGHFAPTVREFLAQSWTIDPQTGTRSPRCQGPDCFLGDAAASDPKEDWARTFDYVLLRPLETAVLTNFSLNAPTPMQEKVRLIRSIAKIAEPVKGMIRFGAARVLDVAETDEATKADVSPALPSNLPQTTIRRIYVAGKSSVQPFVWGHRRRSFMVGDHVVFPVFQKDRKTLGFLVYDLKDGAFRPATFDLENIPRELREAAATFSDLRILEAKDGSLVFVGLREGEPALAAPITFDF
jgi:hypothetical protein